MGGYHSHFLSLYWNSGTVYDILCFFFYFSAFLYYIGIRKRQSYLNLRQVLAVLGLYVCALNSKEMAVTFPLFIGVYELLYHPPAAWSGKTLGQWVMGEGRVSGIAAVATLPYLWNRTYSPQSPYVNLDAYTPVISWEKYIHTYAYYLHLLFHAPWFEKPPVHLKLLTLLGSLLVIAWATKSAALKFCWVFIVLSVLPIVFVPLRAGFVLYIPMVGWAVYAAILLVRARDFLFETVRRLWLRLSAWVQRAARLTARSARRLWLRLTVWVQPKQLLLFSLAVFVLVRWNWEERTNLEGGNVELQQVVRSMTLQLSELHPTLPKGARVLFLSDPFEGRDYDTLFLLRLYYKDRTLEVDSVRRMQRKPDALALAGYDYIFTYDEGRLIEIKRGKSDMKSILGPYIFDPASRISPLRIGFAPDKVRPGFDNYVIEIPGMENSAVDLLYSFKGAFPQVNRYQMDASSRAKVFVPQGIPAGLVRVLGVRRSGHDLWLAAEGTIEVVP